MSHVLSYHTLSPVCKQFLSCVLREPRFSSLVIFQVLGPLRSMASNTIIVHSRGSLTIVGLFFFYPLFLRFLEPCLSIFCVFVLFLLVPSWLLQIVLAFFGFCILSTRPYHPSRTDFINFTLSASCNSPLPPCFVLILQLSPSLASLYIFLTVPPLKYSERVRFFHRHCPSFRPISLFPIFQVRVTVHH